MCLAGAIAWRLGRRSAAAALEPRHAPRLTPAPRSDSTRAPTPKAGEGEGEGEGTAPLEEELVERYLIAVRDALGAEAVVYWSVSVDGEPTVAASSLGGGRVTPIETSPPVESLVRWTAEQRIPAANHDGDAPFFLAAHVGTPDRPHGAVGLFASDRRQLARDRARALLPRHASRLAALLDLLEDGRETRRYRGKAEVLARAAERIQASTDLDSLGAAIAEASLQVTGGTRAAFVQWDEERERGEVVSVSGRHPLPTGFEVAARSFVGTACLEGTRFTIRENYRSSDYPLFGPAEPARAVRSIIVVPLQHDGRSLGAVAVEGEDEKQLTHVEASLLLLLASVSAVALTSARAFETVREQSKRDALTGLGNRRTFDDELRKQVDDSDRYGQPFSLVLADIDHFKRVNDEHGHAAGDAVLVAVARALERGVRAFDLAARYGGEELAVVLPRTPLAAAREVAERLRRTVEGLEIEVERGKRLRVTMSFGVACYPESTPTSGKLFALADEALYAAKGAGRNCVRASEAKHSGVVA
ncbi:MAG TPA: sensor domain-containing diguanylate cyclase [Gemmatimonadaceae bacterium]